MHDPSTPTPSRRSAFARAVLPGALVLALAGCGGGSPDAPAGGGERPGTLPTAGTVTVSGTAAVGHTLTAVPLGFGLGTPEGGLHYRWQQCVDGVSCATVFGVGSDQPTYLLADQDVETYVRVGVYVSNACASGCGESATAFSAALLVGGLLPVAGTVTVTGTPAVGQTLTAIPAGFDLGVPAGAYHYAWERCADATCSGSPVAVGSDSETYVLVDADAGRWVRAGVLASNACAAGCGASATAWSDAADCPTITCASSCAGCCTGETCTASPSADACGANGSSCVACDPARADSCTDGACRCGAQPACGPGQRCQNGACSCDMMSCPSGCCAGSTCMAPSLATCGAYGSACLTCDPMAADRCGNGGACACGSGPTCQPGQQCVGGVCVPAG